jgi:geranylgeranyl reductase family protein
MERFDVLVVGAGPAGSTAAYRLASAGASVLLADKARFPRDKPCGGGLTMRAVRQLPFSVDPVVEDRTTCVRFGLDFKHRVERRLDEPLVLMTQRKRLDAFLVEQAAAAGAHFRDGVKVSELVLDDDGVRAQVDGSPVTAAHALLADGANGVSARAVGLDDGREHGVALEANVPYGVVSENYRGVLCLELANVPGGYGWLFPKGDHVNVGVGGWEREGPRLREHLARFCREYDIPDSSLEDVRGYRLPLVQPRARLAKGRAALLGDAAGLVDPLSGDGMYEAFLSARLATEAVLAGRALETYDRELRRTLSSQLAAAWGAKVALDRFPRLTYAVVRTPFLWNAVVSLIGGDVPSPSSMRGLRRASMKAVEAIARAAGNPGKPYRAVET